KIADDVTVERPQLVDGALLVPDAPGLGLRLDAARLERYSVAVAHVEAGGGAADPRASR
ncbi:MAG: hypothetical protein HY691_15430, partial [Chloroflexi bacterium]|nr:hypothetical protein [Chloroflexota bacterium]